MNFLVTCDCGHTLEFHLAGEGCSQCRCDRDRSAALDALVDALRADGPPPGEMPGITRRTATGSILRRVAAAE